MATQAKNVYRQAVEAARKVMRARGWKVEELDFWPDVHPDGYVGLVRVSDKKDTDPKSGRGSPFGCVRFADPFRLTDGRYEYFV
jgi:hypothetical protein